MTTDQHADDVRDGTHWHNCYRSHLECANIEIERLRRALYQLAEDAEVAHQGGIHNDGAEA